MNDENVKSLENTEPGNRNKRNYYDLFECVDMRKLGGADLQIMGQFRRDSCNDVQTIYNHDNNLVHVRNSLRKQSTDC